MTKLSKSSDIRLLALNIGFTWEVDGPGQRMVVYLKGCNMRCLWCAAPESILPRSEVLFYPSRLDDPNRAAKACPYGAVRSSGRSVARDVGVCASCDLLSCLDTDNPAFERAGREIGVNEVVERVMRYRSSFSNLGVTIGGGEPTCQFDAVSILLTRLHGAGVHTAIETNGVCAELPGLFGVIDLLYIDLKHPDSAKCAEITGQGNQTVLDNIRTRRERGGVMIVRIPLVPGYNADEQTLHKFGAVLSEIGRLTVEILPFHRRGEVKWRALGIEPPAADARQPSTHEMESARDILTAYGLSTV